MNAFDSDTEAKSRLRQEMRRIRHDAALKQPEASLQLSENIFRFSALQDLPVVAAYCAINDEIDPLYFLRTYHKKGGQVVLPVMGQEKDGKGLTFHLWAPDSPLVRGAYGVLEPERGSPPIQPQILFLPLLAFDQEGYRLGYGKGYYDRTLSYLRQEKSGSLAVGLAFDCQEVPHIPHEPHDQKLDYVMTPTRVLSLRGQ